MMLLLVFMLVCVSLCLKNIDRGITATERYKQKGGKESECDTMTSGFSCFKISKVDPSEPTEPTKS